MLYGGGEVKKARCNWVHGWKWYAINDFRLLGPNSLNMRFKTIVVTNRMQHFALKNAGFKRVIQGGLPFSYILDYKINNQIKFKKNKDILVILPKSQSYMPTRNAFSKMISYVSDSPNLKNRAIFCVFPSDIKKPECISLLNKSDIPFISGASIDDRYGLIRIRDIFSSFNYAITNTIGSHIPYMAALGLNVSILGPFDERPAAFFASDPILASYGDKFLNYLEFVHSEKYAKDNLPHFFDGSFNQQESIKWGLSEIGYDSRLSKDQLSYILGWNTSGFARAAFETSTRLLFKLIR
jgi:hypothetical protein